MTLLYKHISIILGLLFSLTLIAQEDISLAKLDKEITFKVFKTQDYNLSLNTIAESNKTFKIPSSIIKKTHPDDVYWIRLDFEEELQFLKSNSTWYLTFNTFGHGELFYLDNNAIVKRPIGQFDSPTTSEKIKSKKYFSELSFTRNSLINNRYLYLKVKRVKFLESLNNWRFSYTQNPMKDLYVSSETKSLLPIYTFVGITSIMGIIMLVFFFYFKRLEFLFYSLYVLALLVFITKDEWQIFENFLPYNTLVKNWTLESLQVFIPLGYMLFMIFYLNLKKDYSFAFHVLKISIYILLSLCITDFLFFYFEYHIGHIYFLESLPILALTTALFSIGYIFIYNKNRISSLFVFGSSFFLIGTGVYFYKNNDSDPLFYYNKLYLIIGSSIEIVIFAFGLIYKIFTEHLDKINFQQEAVLNKNKALRAQINPHFIFNSLSSIQSFITGNDKVSALKYLSKFSSLTRNILESSIETNVVLNDEIKMLNDYLELESLRFDNAFSYRINIDDAIDVNSIEVPFMILQPFVENAIIHGLLPKENGNKELTINFKKMNSLIICEIDDNGIGREAASLKEHIHKKEKKSRGLEITLQRLQSLSDDENENNIEIIDKVDDNDNVLGTTIIVRIPI